MNLFVKVLYFNVGIIFVCAQNDGRYRAVSSSVTQLPVVITDGRYRPSNDGRYNSGNDGRYRPGNDGKYTHIGDKDRGQYTGSGGEYTGGGGQYTGTDSNGGQYTGNGGEYNGGFGQYSAGNGKPITEKKPQTDSTGVIGVIPETTIKPKPNPKPQPSGNGEPNPKPQPSGNGEPNPKPQPSGNGVPNPKPQPSGNGEGGWKIIRDEKTEDTDGYHYLYETENGILAEESGRIEKLTPEDDGLRSKGFYQYTGDDGVLYRVDYVADNNGFVPQGDHIPKTPPAIQKLLDYLALQS